jgi:hypothetical protein
MIWPVLSEKCSSRQARSLALQAIMAVKDVLVAGL